jgi:thiol-disulfide isomerase/thioredoxin/Tfp pilus assembly protein PilF
MATAMASHFMLIAALLLALQAPAAESPGTPEARASFDAGRAAARAGDQAKAAALFRKAIDSDPRYVEAHDEFISATTQAAFAYDAATRTGNDAAKKRAEQDLKTLYDGWAKAQPGNPVYQWALSKLAGKDWDAAERHLLRAIDIRPAFARPYQDLSLIAELRGDNEGRLTYLKKAADLNPTDASYFFYYASAMKSVDRAASVALLQEVATKFPATERGAQGLYWAAYETQELPAKIAMYERLKTEFPPEKFSWSESGMSDLFDVLAATTPDRARALAAEMLTRIASASEQKSWTDLAAYAAALSEAAALRAKGDGKGAVQRLEAIKPLASYRDQAPLAIARAQALEAAGDRAAAYAILAAAAAKSPTDGLLDALGSTGRALGMTAPAIDDDLWQRREAAAKPAPAFTLPDYPDRKDVSLADYRGKVVLLNFWYPSCGPCRGEFPALQRVLDKYRDRGFAILSLNVLPEEKAFVMPYLTKNRFTFRALETDTDWAEKTYAARGFPTNLLVGADGRIMFKPGIIRSPREQRTFELQIEALLAQASRRK